MLASGVLAAVVLMLVMPARLVIEESPWLAVASAVHLATWLAALVFLLWFAVRTRSGGAPPSRAARAVAGAPASTPRIG